MRLAGNTGRKKSPFWHHRTNLSGYIFGTKACIDNRKKALSGCVFATTACIDNWKNLLNSDISSTRPHNMANFGPLTAEICSGVLGTPANFNGFCVLPSSLLRRRSLEANHTLHDVWPYPALLHYIYIFGGLAPDRILPVAKFTLRPSLALSYIGTVTAWHSGSGRQPNFAPLNIGRHLYLAGRPSGWALAHISSFELIYSVHRCSSLLTECRYEMLIVL